MIAFSNLLKYEFRSEPRKLLKVAEVWNGKPRIENRWETEEFEALNYLKRKGAGNDEKNPPVYGLLLLRRMRKYDSSFT